VKSNGTSPSQERTNSPSRGCDAATALEPNGGSICRTLGFTAARFDGPIHADQSFRNHSVGKRCSSAASGPRLAVVILTRMSSALPLAYSTKTSK
jgi:hypothetical protein